MGIKQLFSKSYIDWEDYVRKIVTMEHIYFIDGTARESYQNLMKKGGN